LPPAGLPNREQLRQLLFESGIPAIPVSAVIFCGTVVFSVSKLVPDSPIARIGCPYTRGGSAGFWTVYEDATKRRCRGGGGCRGYVAASPGYVRSDLDRLRQSGLRPLSAAWSASLS